jgi:mono/diheme cytochrome c family protein
MRARAIVLSHADYEAWASEQEGGGTDTGGSGTDTGVGTETGGGGEAGAAIFTDAGCAGCHTLSAADSSAEVGPNLDNVLGGMDEAAIRAAIVDPNAEIAEGYQPNVMPQDYGQRLSDEELDALVAFLVEAGKARR